MKRSVSERSFAFVRSIPGGRFVWSVRRVSVTHAMRSRIHLTDPARALMTSKESVESQLRKLMGISVEGRQTRIFKW